MQKYTNIPSTNTLTESREKLLNNDMTALSCSSGSAFPVDYAVEGMLCFRNDLKQLFQLEKLPADLESNWHLIADLNHTYTNKTYIDGNFALKDGTYAGLRAQSTTKEDVGLGNLPNTVVHVLNDASTNKLVSAKAIYDLNQIVAGHTSLLSKARKDIDGKASISGSASRDFSAASLYAANTIYCNGDIVSEAGVTIPSDERLKSNITPIDDALERLMPLTGVRYTLKSTKQKHVGLIAQQVAQTIPEVVRVHNGYLALDYASIVGVLVNAVNELNARLKNLELVNAKI